MATILLVFIYTFYIGLGIPDSLLGSAWPAIYGEFHVPISYASFISAIISAGTVISSLFSTKVIARLGTAKVTAISTTLTAIALLGFSCSQSFLWLCLCAVPLGIGTGSIDSALNNYVALHYNAMQMSFLHCFYGIGVTASPYLMSLALSESMNWRGGYRTVFYIQLVIAAVTNDQTEKNLGVPRCICRDQRLRVHLSDLGKYILIRDHRIIRRYGSGDDHVLFCRHDPWTFFLRSAFPEVF